PALDHARDSGRARGFAYEGMVAHSMPASRPLEMIVPRLYGVIDPDVRHFWGGAAFGGAPYLLSVYAGFAVAALAVAGLIARVRGTGIVAAIAVVSYILAIGDSTPLYRLLHAIGMRSIRYPEKFIASAVFVLIVFAAVVADRLLGGDDRLLRKTRIVSIVFVIIAAAAALIAFSPSLFASVWQSADASAARAPLSLGAGLAVAWLIAFLAFGRVDRQRWSAAVFVLLLVDVVWLGRSFAPARGRAFFTAPPIAKQLRGEPGIFNVVNRGDWAVADPNRGKTTALSRSFAARNAMTKMTPALWNIRTVMQADFDATFLLATHEFMDAMTRAARSGRGDWAEAFMAVSNVRYVLDYRDFETAMRESRGDLMHARPVVATRRPNRGQYYFSNDEGRVLSMRETANTATVEVDAHTPALLFATVTRHKYWRATVDGEPVRPVGANIAYQAIPVPQGRHRVEMRYFNPLVVVSGLVSLATIVALAIMTLRRRRPRPQSES
ncbi:MAG TPA: YfhO family protein, partial [Thermoanaerobaculia bacterium]